MDTASIPDMHFHSDWAIANPTVRDKVLSSRMVIIYTHETDNAMIEIGNRIETPEGVFYELEYGGEGNIYKNEDAFLNRPDEVCYIPNTRQKTVRTGVCGEQ